MNITLKKVNLKSKKTGKDFQAYELKAGLYSTLIFPSPLEMEYLDRALIENAHKEFADDDSDNGLF